MKKTSRFSLDHKFILSLFSNLLLAGLECYAVYCTIARYGSFIIFQYYTIDSNFLCLLSSIVFFVFGCIGWKKKTYQVPLWVRILRLTASGGLALTFLVVVCVLCPAYGPSSWVMMLFQKEMLFHHFLCPIISVASFLILETDKRIKLKHTLYPLAYTLAYAIPVLILNICHVITGPYPFLEVYNQAWYLTVLYIVGILGFDYLLIYLLSLPSLILSKRAAKEKA